MSKCREAFESQFSVVVHRDASGIYIDTGLELKWRMWQAAWNARGEVDAEICRKAWHDDSIELANTIEQEQCE